MTLPYPPLTWPISQLPPAGGRGTDGQPVIPARPTSSGPSAGGTDADDAGEVELCLVLAAGNGSVNDDLQVGIAVAEHVAVHGDVADIGVTDGLAVLGVPTDGAVAP